MEILIITGESGSGKTWAYEYFEDSGYYCIDNLPSALIINFVELMQRGKKSVSKAAFVIDVRSGDFTADLLSAKDELLAMNIKVKILYLSADEDILLKRFAQTRRQHPLATAITNEAAIKLEKEQLAPIREIADIRLDTGSFKSSAQFFNALTKSINGSTTNDAFKIIISSFGYKNGLPKEADMMFDMRFIPNPFYIDELKAKNGNDAPVYDFVMNAEISKWFKARTIELIKTLVPAYINENKGSLNLAFGCTGGQHRSVAMANCLYRELKEDFENIVLVHRDITD